MSYLADDHTHSRISPDARHSMAEIARAAADAGMQELCFTDHTAPVEFRGTDLMEFYDWDALSREFSEAQKAEGSRIALHLGVEFGDAPLNFAHSEKLLAAAPPLDFIIGSIHRLSPRYGCEDLYFGAADDPKTARDQIADYLAEVLELAQWGQFSVLGHLTLPLRYLNENRGLHMTFDGFEGEVAEIFRALIENGCGIEVNTNRGNLPLPDARWLKLYHSLGGEIVTVGSDAHTPEMVGCHVREAQDLLRACGFTRVCTFEKKKPIFHNL